jgi:2-polyprenyl-6-methoxyphenol hydroxylase-like FAD-dependent oxidoreductase
VSAVRDHLIVIPAFDEAPTIAEIVTRARRHGPVLVVDDGSRDGTGARAAEAGADVLRLEPRRGKGEALRAGFAAARARSAERVVTLDGDGQHSPEEIPRLLEAAAGAPRALVVGQRLDREGGALDPTIPTGRRLANQAAGFFIDWLTGTPLADTQSGFRVYPVALGPVLDACRGGFVLESEVIVRAAEAGWGLAAIPIDAKPAAGRRSRFRPLRDGVAITWMLVARGLRRLARDAGAATRALVGPLAPERRRARHRELAHFVAGHGQHAGGALFAVGVFFLHRVGDTWRTWGRDPRLRALGVVGPGIALLPLLLALAALHRPLQLALGLDLLSPFVGSVYSQPRLARALGRGGRPATDPVQAAPPACQAPSGGAVAPEQTRIAPAASPRDPDVDVLVVGGGPGGSTIAAFLAQGGLSVGIVEREPFPRFRVGESLIPNCMPILERMGVLERVRAHGFQPKYGVTFHDQEIDAEHSFYFRDGRPWPNFTYDVHRAEFDAILLDHAAKQPGVRVLQPAAVERVSFDADGVTAEVSDADGTRPLRARFLVDASGRDAFLPGRMGGRRPVPGLGKVAIFAYYRGARRFPGRQEGNVRIYNFPDGWFWWIPLARDETSVGCVLHARTVRGREGSPADLLETMIARCRRVRDGLVGAERVTPIYTAANFSYRMEPVVGDRFLCAGDAVAFVDPIFSAGVFMAMVGAEWGAQEILRAFREDRFEARRLAGYERRLDRAMRPFATFIEHFYDPLFLELFLRPKDVLGMVDAVTFVLAGGAVHGTPIRMRLSLAVFFSVVRAHRWLRRLRGATAESRLEW